MRNILIGILMIAVAIWGYHLMARLDRYIDAHVSDDERDDK